MSGDHREQQEFGECVREGATLVISLDGLSWFCRRRCTDKEERKKKRDEELQLWMSSGHMMLPDERLLSSMCLRVSDHSGRSTLNLWRTSVPHPSPQNCRLTGKTKQASRTRLVLNARDIFTWITSNGHLETQQNTMTMDRPNGCVIFRSEDAPSRLFSDCTILEKTVSHTSDNNNITAYTTSDPNNNPVVDHCEATRRERFDLPTHKSLLKHPAESTGRDRDVNRKKSVSFDDAVVVYLFDQESPTMELQSGTNPNVTFEDNSLEWEDDFSALEESLQVRHVGLPLLPRPLQNGTPQSRRRRDLLPQTCLFLTHVTESDLEL